MFPLAEMYLVLYHDPGPHAERLGLWIVAGVVACSWVYGRCVCDDIVAVVDGWSDGVLASKSE